MKQTKFLLLTIVSLLTIAVTPVTALARNHSGMGNHSGNRMTNHSEFHNSNVVAETQTNSNSAVDHPSTNCQNYDLHTVNQTDHMSSERIVESYEPSVTEDELTRTTVEEAETNVAVQTIPINKGNQQGRCQFKAFCEYRTDDGDTEHHHNWAKQPFDHYPRCLPTF